LREGTQPRISRKKRIALLVIVPLALALHVWLIALGGGWRIFALTEAGIGIFLALALRDLKKMNGE
jgi:hypothetical protein